MEVRLLHSPVLDGVFTPEDGGQTVHHAALELGHDVVGVDGITGVNADHDAVDLDLVFGVDGDIAHASRPAAITVGGGHAPEHTRCRFFVPPGRFGHRQQDSTVAVGFFIVGQHGQAVFHRVFGCRLGHLVDEALTPERVL